MASFKPFFRNDIIYIQAIHKRKTKLKKMASCKASDWDKKNMRVKKTDPNYKKINLLISKRISALKAIEIDYDLNELEYTVEDLFYKKRETSIIDCIDSYIQFLRKANKLDAKRKNENIKAHVSNFKDVSVRNIDLKYLKNLELYLLSKVSANTTYKYFSTIKTSLKYSGYAPLAFNQLRLKRTPPKQVTITQEEFKLFEEYDYGDKQVRLDAHLLQYYTWGTRISNILTLRATDLTPNTILFKEVKDNPIIKEVPITEKIRIIIDKYVNESDFVIPLIKNDSSKQIESKTAMINSSLKLIAAKLGIDKNMSTHVARYSFVTWLDETDVPLKYRKEMLNHSNERMTEHYSSAKKDIHKLSKIAKKLF